MPPPTSGFIPFNPNVGILMWGVGFAWILRRFNSGVPLLGSGAKKGWFKQIEMFIPSWDLMCFGAHTLYSPQEGGLSKLRCSSSAKKGGFK